MTTFNAASSPYARAASASAAAGAAASAAPGPPPEPSAAPEATVVGLGVHPGADLESPVPTPQRHLRVVSDEDAGRTEASVVETPQSPPASGDSDGESSPAEAVAEAPAEPSETPSEAPAAPAAGPSAAERLTALLVPPVQHLFGARPASLTEKITYHYTGPQVRKDGPGRKVNIAFNRLWAVPYTATGRLLEWAFADRVSRTLFFSGLTGVMAGTVYFTAFALWHLFVIAVLWWIAIAIIAYVIGAPKKEGE